MKKFNIILITVLVLIILTMSSFLIFNNNTMVKETVKEVLKWSNIAVSYTGKLEDWSIFDATSKHWWTPLEFTAWAGQMIKGFDDGVIGMKLNETKTIEIEAKDAYGEYDPANVQVVPKDQLSSFTAAGFKLEKWEKLPTWMWDLEILEVTETWVTLDVNHSLAGKKLIFEVKVVDIK